MNNLVKLRVKICLSQKELAEKLGVSRQTIVNFEKGGKCKPELILKICEMFEKTPCQLLGMQNLLFVPKNKEDFKIFIDILNKEYNKWD